MSALYPTLLERRQATSIEKGRTVADVRERRSHAQRVLANAMQTIRDLREIGASAAYVEDTTAGLLDEMKNIEATFYRDLEAAGLYPDLYTLDLSELEDFLAKVMK